jgi:hypothetical protein
MQGRQALGAAALGMAATGKTKNMTHSILVLVAEDEATIQFVMEVVLTDAGFSVLTAGAAWT